MSSEIAIEIAKNQAEFGLALRAEPAETVEKLSHYYDLVMKQNALLHLVAPCSAAEFAVRHILESLTLLKYLPQNACFADVGPGAGLPSIPCLIARADLGAHLIESKEKKARFLGQTIEQLGLSQRATIVTRQFEEIECPPEAQFVACRALDKFTQKLPKLLKWAKGKKLLLFGGPALESELAILNIRYHRDLMPLSEQRYLISTDA
jgi:16S rRNA (guanine527-N7)-methyltransferase